MQVRIRTKGATSYLQTVAHEGRTYLIAPAEGEYEIVITNNCNRRRMAVIAVDGMSVMDGKLAKRGDRNGYVLNAWLAQIPPGAVKQGAVPRWDRPFVVG